MTRKNPNLVAPLGALMLAGAAGLVASATASTVVAAEARCESCATWNEPTKPFRIYGNTWYVGTRHLSAVLVTSDYGHVLIDGALPQSVDQIAANIEALGFKLGDVKAILNSHEHFDHAGGIAGLQQRTGAQVYARRPANDVLTSGKPSKNDPQFALKLPAVPKVPQVWVVNDDQLLGVGGVRLRAIATPGHTQGGTTWTWESCEGGKCLQMVYADSLSAISGKGFRFGPVDGNGAGAELARSIDRVGKLACDVLITPHPEASALFERIARRPESPPEAIREEGGCQRYAQSAREKLEARVREEG